LSDKSLTTNKSKIIFSEFEPQKVNFEPQKVNFEPQKVNFELQKVNFELLRVKLGDPNLNYDMAGDRFFVFLGV
jgi:hypothetical protein